MATKVREAIRNRVELLIPIRGGGYLCEQLDNPEYPDTLGKVRCIGGKIEEGETPIRALRRELMEEYDLWLSSLNPPHHPYTSHGIHEGEHFSEEVFHGDRGKIIRFGHPEMLIQVANCLRDRKSNDGGHEHIVIHQTQPAPWR
jgi:8-oxo-dGTP pyrophosphatase MutT (NUDIX family)